MSRETPFTFYEFFAGGGMARLGLGDGWNCLFANDFDPLKAATYRSNFGGDHLHQGDVWAVDPIDLPGRADLAWASSPCQDVSLAGTRTGLSGARSSAFWGFWRLVEALNRQGRAPRVIVIENVTGLLTSHHGADFTALCKSLYGQGYSFGAVEIDAVRFVPQSRARVFIVATRNDAPHSVSQIEGTLPFHSKRITGAFERLPADLKASWVWWRFPFPEAQNEFLESVLEPDNQVPWLSEQKTKRLISLLNERHREKLRVARTRGERTVGTLFRRMRTEAGKKHQRAELRFDGTAGCLRTPGGGSSKQFVIVVNGEIVKARALTSRECARLMAIPEDYSLPPRTTAALHVTGDGVVVKVVDFIRASLLEPLLRLEAKDTDAKGEERRRARA
jgi:DNA (cytosine-5)-methyltransferase 1